MTKFILLTLLSTIGCEQPKSINNQLINEAMDQLEIVERTTKDPIQLCLRAQLVAETLLQSREEKLYQQWMSTTVKQYCQ